MNKYILLLVVVAIAILFLCIRYLKIRKQNNATLIVLNGTSSVGKTSTARELQYLLGKNYLYITMDHFLDMLSYEICNLNPHTETFLQKNEGFYASKRPDGTFDIQVGSLGKKMLHDMYEAVDIFLQHGWNVIFTVVQPVQMM